MARGRVYPAIRILYTVGWTHRIEVDCLARRLRARISRMASVEHAECHLHGVMTTLLRRESRK